MSNLGPVYLAWANLRHKGSALLGPLLALVVCLLLLFTLVGAYLVVGDRPVGLPPADQGTVDKSGDGGEKELAESRNRSIREGGSVGLCLVVLLLFRFTLARELAGLSHEFGVLHTLGYGKLYLLLVYVAEMLLLILLAFLPALALTPAVDAFVAAWTGWPLALNWTRVGVVLLLAGSLGAFAALLAAQHLRKVPLESLLR